MASKVNCNKFPKHPNCKNCKKTPGTPGTPGTPTTPKKDPFKEYDKLNQKIQKILEIDSDGDGIPDALEKNGYTISEVFDQEHGYFNVMPWSETYDHNPDFYNHHPKYISNPFDKNTVGDPYTDLEKAGRSIYIEGSILPEAYHPLVAACPSVATFMEGFILKDVQDKENTSTTGQSYHTSYGFEDTKTVGNGTDLANSGKLEFGGKGVKNGKGGEQGGETSNVSGSVHLSRNLKHHTNEQQGVTTISSLQEAHQQTTESSTTIHSASAAILQGIVRYQNMGTAKISNMRPTLNFQVEERPLFTYKVPDVVAKLSPGDSYPSLDATGAIVTPGDSFQGHPSTIDTGAKKKLAEGKPLKVVTTQIDGTFKATAGSGKYAPGKEVEWSQVTDTMMKRTARLLLETPNETLDRRVAAPSTDEVVGKPDKTKPESGIPRITVEQAIQIAFGARKNNRGNLVLTTQQGLTYKIDRLRVALHVNEDTDALISKQLQAFKDKGDDTKSVYDVTLTKEMVILIKPILEVNAFLNNNYLYIENYFDQSLSYSVWKNTGTSSELLKQGIVPSASTIGTGYLCDNPAEELYILVSKQVSQVIFKGKVSSLQGFNWKEEKEEKLLPMQQCFEKCKGFTKEELKSSKPPVMYWHTDYGDDTWWRLDYKTKRNRNLTILYRRKLGDETKQTREAGLGTDREVLLFKKTEGLDLNDKLSVQIDGGKKYDLNSHFDFNHWLEVPPGNKRIFDLNLSIRYLKYDYNKIVEDRVENLGPIKVPNRKFYTQEHRLSKTQVKISEKKKVLLYQTSDSGEICLLNKQLENVSYCIQTPYQEWIRKGELRPFEILKFTKGNPIIPKSYKFGTFQPLMSDEIIITIDDIPIFYGIPERDFVYKEKIDTLQKVCLDYWHLNENNGHQTYDYVSFKPLNGELINTMRDFELIVEHNSIGKHSTRPLELNGKLIVNFFDYTGDTNQHPRKGQQVDIIAHDIFGNTHTVFSGKAELTDALWKAQYKVSEWHKKGEQFDALYLSPIPTGLTEDVKSYDIQINQDIYKSVSFERQDNGGYVRDQRLKLDFSNSKFYQEKLPRLGDSIKLTIHTMDDKCVEIDLGKVEECTKPDSINILERVHVITEWTKKDNHYTCVHFKEGNKEEEKAQIDHSKSYVSSYLFKVNNRYYGEISISNETRKLDLTECNNNMKIQKGDYVEIYAYKKDGEGVLIQSRYAGTTGLLGAYPTTDNIKKASYITNWAKANYRYTTFTLNIADSIDSYIKKYEGCINNHIINLTPKGLTFAFDTDKEPRHGDIVQLFAYTYSGDKIELWKLPAGATEPVNDEEVRSIYEVKGWEDTNQTIVFNTSDLQDCIQAYIQSYTIEVWNKSQTKWETFGKAIQMNEKGQLRLQDCKASQPMPQPPNFIRVQTNFFDSERKPVVIMIRIVGEIKKPPTEKEMKDAHTGFVWNFEGEQLKSITFPHVNLALANYISSYRVNKWANVIPEKSKFTVETSGLTLVFEKPIDIASMHEVAVGGGRKESQLVKDEFSAVVYWMNIEGRQLIETLVIGDHVGKTDVKGVVPVRSMSTGDIVKAHQIDSWIFTYDQKQVEGFALRQMPEPILAQIDYYTVVLDEKEFPMPDYSHYKGKMKEQKTLESEPDAKTKKGYVFRFDAFQIPYANHPKPGNEITIKANLVGGSNLIVIDKKKIELE
ncbi:binary toxin-like calcium binding domain-containing protein [Bacillus thuringiensis]|uniref:binary toxin-like calcium binding domain-containing protein n=1 Tax=Bacillus thuringiensis TaxID=1428 RepID=UPI00211D8068|nr:binary toxin-like calcium binding domain-containing protein [Bacillus thuringiensis]